MVIKCENTFVAKKYFMVYTRLSTTQPLEIYNLTAKNKGVRALNTLKIMNLPIKIPTAY